MTKPGRFVLSTDYATLKNDASTSTTITIPASQVIAAGSQYIVTSDVVVGQTNAGLRGQISSSKDSNKRYLGTYQSRVRSGLITGFPATYDLNVYAARLSSNTVRVTVTVFNPYSDPLTTATGDETFTIYLTTFLSPFQ